MKSYLLSKDIGWHNDDYKVKHSLYDISVRTGAFQIIAWTKVDLVHQRIYAALGGDELNLTYGC